MGKWKGRRAWENSEVKKRAWEMEKKESMGEK
jgi:hypothetical protein